MANERNVYLELEGATGLLFEYSKTEKEGFTRVETENPTTKATTVSYRKYHQNGVFGNLVGFKTREKEISGRKITMLNIILDNPVKDKTFFISLPWLTTKGSVSDYSVSAISYLPFLKKGNPYRVFPYAIKSVKNNKERKNYGVSIAWARLSDDAYDDTNKLTRLSFESKKANDAGEYDVTPGDIPAVDFTEYMDDIVADTKKRDLYLWGVLKENYIEYSSSFQKKTFNSKEEGLVVAEESDVQEGQAQVPSPDPNSAGAPRDKKAQKASVIEQAPEEEEDDSDLPF